jgi:negative regulator of genetic competence, sporulation and motility
MTGADDLTRSIRRQAAFASQIQKDAERQSRDMEAALASIQDAKRQEIEREKTVATSTKAMADLAAEQHEENRRLRYLTTLLGFAVIYDVVNGSFDDHTWWTTLISVGAAVGGLTAALLLGRWRARRAS